MAAIRPTLNNAMAHVNTYKNTTGVVDGFLTQAHKDTFLKVYAPISVAASRDAFSTAVGATRAVEYTIASMTAGEKTSTGLDRIAPNLLAAFSNSGSMCVHEGEVGNFIIEDGAKVYHIPGANPNESDFIDYKKLLEYHMAYSYINDSVSASNPLEKSNSLAAYNDFKDSL